MSGPPAGDGADHGVHLHVFPRFTGDPFRIEADWQVRERRLLDETAAAVRSGLAGLG
ncbi:hypothetical protein LIX60_05165 [Streptomyces sp. S07_1.15]|uniref:hypothetical protein n=1 Tax=Streptomyces sp. S07_1.15 TaxID=2873925 RepID=UPI001D15DAF2|nr:hypothetical protein [Streptomyces sp. S07_1.15]MCC3650875.1 hypothetical protein [Streptomyces sp. S07_1.15]